MSSSCRSVSLADIKTATKDFSKSMILGRGGEGTVYKGIFNYHQREITLAVKRLRNSERSNIDAEIKMLSRLSCSHLVSLFGYCIESGENILLYEYMNYGNLYKNLHGEDRSALSWERRLNICIGAAKGLSYLHYLPFQSCRIIHRDIKTGNILLNENWEAKIADFGMAKKDVVLNELQSEVVTKFNNGTPEYQPKELLKGLRLSRRSDVYAFGVVLIEILTSKVPFEDDSDEEDENIAVWAQRFIKIGKYQQIVDPEIMNDQISLDSLNVFISIMVKCLDECPRQRPSMAQVVVALESALHEQRQFIIGKLTNKALGELEKIRVKRKLLSPQYAAVVVQRTFRSYRIRSSRARWALRDLAIAKTKLKDLRTSFCDFVYLSRLIRSAEERQAFHEEVGTLLLTVKAIEGFNTMVRVTKRKMVEMLEKMYEAVDPNPQEDSDSSKRTTFKTAKVVIPKKTFKAAFTKSAGVFEESKKELPSPHDAATTIQMRFRAYLIRKYDSRCVLRGLATFNAKLKELRALFFSRSYRRRLDRDAQEKKKFSANIMSLLHKFRGIEGVSLESRTAKRERVDELEEMLKVVDPLLLEDPWKWIRVAYNLNELWVFQDDHNDINQENSVAEIVPLLEQATSGETFEAVNPYETHQMHLTMPSTKQPTILNGFLIILGISLVFLFVISNHYSEI